MNQANRTPQTDHDLLDEFLGLDIRLFIFDRYLLSQIERVLAALHFSRVAAIPINGGYMESVRQLAPVLRDRPDLVLASPPLVVRGGGKTVTKELRDFFSDVRILLSKKDNDGMDLLGRCLPVVVEASLSEIRERLLLTLAEFGVSGAFILGKQAPLMGLPPAKKTALAQEQLIERYNELKAYLTEYLTGRDDAFEQLKSQQTERAEEADLTRRKAEADRWMAEADKLKKARNYDQAIACLKKAVQALPDDPEPYLETGRTHVKMKAYPKALSWFRQAGEVAEDLPAPDEEIGQMRLTQVKEMIEQGTSPNDPEIKAYLDEAADHLSLALEKAAAIKPLHDADTTNRADDIVLAIANGIFKSELANSLGLHHPLVHKINALAGQALADVSGEDPDRMTPMQQISLGWSLFNQGQFNQALDNLFQALESGEYFRETATEINIMGTQLRTRQGPRPAVAVYKRLLEHDPPNRASVYFNLAVAQRQINQTLESAGCLVKAIYIDPFLIKDENFSRQVEMVRLLSLLRGLFTKAAREADRIEIPQNVQVHFTILDHLEESILEDKARALGFLRRVIARTPAFFNRPEVYFSTLIMDFSADMSRRLIRSPDPKINHLGRILSALLKRRYGFQLGSKRVYLLQSLDRAMCVLRLEADQAEAAKLTAQALTADPDYIKLPDLYTNKTLINLIREILRKLGG